MPSIHKPHYEKKTSFFIRLHPQCSPLSADFDIGPSSVSVDLETVASPDTTATFHVIGDIIITPGSGNAIESNLVAGDWTLNNPSFAITGAGLFSSGITLGPITAFTLDNGGSITGPSNGVNVTSSGAQMLTNSGSITGTGTHGIFAVSTASTIDFTNNSGASIMGGTSGVNLDSSGPLTLTNSGSITGTAAQGLLAESTSTIDVTNTGSISSSTVEAIRLDGLTAGPVAHTINLGTGSMLAFGGTTAIQGNLSNNADITTTINLTGTGSQTGDFKGIDVLNSSGTWSLDNTAQSAHAITTINVNDGTLTLNGTVNPSTQANTTTVFSGATLMGTNEFDSTFTDTLDILAGAFHKPGNSIGSTTVAGDYSLAGDIEVEFDADAAFPVPAGLTLPGGFPSPKNSDIVIADKINIVSGATVSAKKLAGTIAVDTVYPFLFAETEFAVDGTPPAPLPPIGGTPCDPDDGADCFGFSDINNKYIDGFKLVFNAFGGFVDADDFLLTLTPVSVSLAEYAGSSGTATPAALAVAANLDAFPPMSGTPLGDIRDALFMLTPAQAASALDELSSTRIIDTSMTTFDCASNVLTRLRNHLADLRNNNPPPRDTSLWLQPLFDFENRKNQSKFVGLHAKTYGFAAGIDKFFWNPQFQLGATIGYTFTDLEWFRNQGNSDINSLFWGAYASWKCLDQCHEGYYIDGALLAGWHDYDNKRRIPALGLTASSNPKGWSIDARIGGGYNFHHQDALITPYGYLDYLWNRQDAFTETGAPGANLKIGEQTNDMFRVELGVSASQNYTYGCDWVFAPKLTLGYVHKKPLGSQQLGTSFVGVNGFTVQGFDKTRNQIAPAAELTAIYQQHTFLSAYYNAEFGSDQQSHTLGLKGSIRF